MIQEIKRVNDDFRIQPYPFPIEELSSSAGSASNSVRASMRRMRTETPSYVPKMNEQDVEIFYLNLKQALKEERYADGLQLIQKFETQWNGELFELYARSIEKEIPFVTRALLKNLGDGLIELSKAYFLAMENDRDALTAVGDGMAHLRWVVEEVIQILVPMGAPTEMTSSIQQQLNAFESFYRGLLEFSLGEKAEAVVHFRAFHTLYMENSGLGEEEVYKHLVMLRIVEKHLGEEILPVPTTVDANDPGALLIAGRFEEALAIIDPFDLSDIYVSSRPLIYIVKGEHALAKRAALESDDLVDHAFVLLLLRGIERNESLPPRFTLHLSKR